MCACMFNPIMSSHKRPRLLPNLEIVKDFDEIYKLVSEYAVVSNTVTELKKVELLADLPNDSQITSLSDALEDSSLNVDRA